MIALFVLILATIALGLVWKNMRGTGRFGLLAGWLCILLGIATGYGMATFWPIGITLLILTFIFRKYKMPKAILVVEALGFISILILVTTVAEMMRFYTNN